MRAAAPETPPECRLCLVAPEVVRAVGFCWPSSPTLHSVIPHTGYRLRRAGVDFYRRAHAPQSIIVLFAGVKGQIEG